MSASTSLPSDGQSRSSFYAWMEYSLPSPTTNDLLYQIPPSLLPFPISQLPTNPLPFLLLAHTQIHSTFPFSSIQTYWLLLFSEASLARAVQILTEDVLPVLRETGVGTLDGTKGEIDEAVEVLDRALIVAGGMGREKEIQGVIGGLEGILGIEGAVRMGGGDEEEEKEEETEEEADMPRPKKRKLNGPSSQNDDSEEEELDDENPDLLPRHSLLPPKIKYSIPSLSSPSLHVFQNHLQHTRTPLILTNTLSHWSALHSWRKKSYWLSRTLNGLRRVPVEVGTSYMDDSWGQKVMRFGEFLEEYVVKSKGETGYLAQHDLFRQIPGLWDGIGVLDYCYLDAPKPDEEETAVGRLIRRKRIEKGREEREKGKDEENKGGEEDVPTSSISAERINGTIPRADEDVSPDESVENDSEIQTHIFLGPACTISPLHHDPHHNILCQVFGRKYIRLYSADKDMFPHEPTVGLVNEKPNSAPETPNQDNKQSSDEQARKGEPRIIDQSNTSRLPLHEIEMSPLEDWDALFPGYSEMEYVECVLEAGQALYIPVGWWHYVRSLETSGSVSFWF